MTNSSWPSAIPIAAEGARPDAALTAGLRVSSGSLRVSVERPRRCAGSVEYPTAPLPFPTEGLFPAPARPPAPPRAPGMDEQRLAE